MIEFDFKAELRRWQGKSAWHLVTLPSDLSATIRHLSSESKRGFGSVRVQCRINDTRWKTSVFPDNESGYYILFIKKEVRSAEDIEVGDTVKIGLELLL